jgi:hypothetical protein
VLQFLFVAALAQLGKRVGADPRYLRPQIAVLKETAGKGTFCSLVMAVVVVKDILVFCCFAVNLELSTVVRPLVHVRRPLCLAAGSLLYALAITLI